MYSGPPADRPQAVRRQGCIGTAGAPMAANTLLDPFARSASSVHADRNRARTPVVDDGAGPWTYGNGAYPDAAARTPSPGVGGTPVNDRLPRSLPPHGCGSQTRLVDPVTTQHLICGNQAKDLDVHTPSRHADAPDHTEFLRGMKLTTFPLAPRTAEQPSAQTGRTGGAGRSSRPAARPALHGPRPGPRGDGAR